MNLRRHFRFGLKAMLIAMTLLGVSLGVYVDRCHKQREAVGQILAHGGRVIYAYEFAPDGTFIPNAGSAVRRYLVSLLGPDYVCDIGGVTLYPDATHPADGQVTCLKALPNLPRLAIWPGAKGSPSCDESAPGGLTDDGAAFVSANLRQLSVFSTTACHLSDDAVEGLLAENRGSVMQISRHPSCGGDSCVDCYYDGSDRPHLVVPKWLKQRLPARHDLEEQAEHRSARARRRTVNR